MKLVCNRCGCEKRYNGAPTMATHYNSFCNNCKDYVLHRVEGK